MVPNMVHSQHSLGLTIVGGIPISNAEIEINRNVSGLKIEESRYDKINHKNREFRPFPGNSKYLFLSSYT